ncbi:MAG TPA: acyl-ACP--UDP-N-acetylglucosamine O-acyltransferase [Saprospiraceae bacterium]|nr:acyl-ACP--UDP-N-acetylglucosamine O-acyltransferase [Saprospiraceae bacterium]
MNNIHRNAKIGRDVQVGPFTTIEEDVVIGKGCRIGANANILNGTRMGDYVNVFPGAVVGAVPQDLKFEGENSTVEIGNHVIIREYCTINRGTKASFKTSIGDHTLLMAYVHVAHDCLIGHHCILANNVNLAGHIQIGNHTVLGGVVGVHQFVKIGEHVMVSGGVFVRKDVPPYVKAAREPVSFVGVNVTGMKRRNFTQEQIHAIQDIYRILFVRGYNITQAVSVIKETLPESHEKELILEFVDQSERGIMRGFRAHNPVNGSVYTKAE